MVNDVVVWGLISFAVAILLSYISLSIIKGRNNRQPGVGFFHPYTNDGGGGERVLWCAIKAIQEENSHLDTVVYTGDHDATPDSLMARAVQRFGVELLYPPKVVHLYKRKWIEETMYPRFTMIGQSLGSIYLSWEALSPLYYFDTCGYAFTYPIARSFVCKVLCYTHYPTISLDMIARVQNQNSMYNSDALIAKRLFAHVAMVNSSWTQSHIESLWRIPDRIKRVHPPCDITGLQSAVPTGASVAKTKKFSCYHLCFLNFVQRRELVGLLGGAVAGIHGMVDEHFGIRDVEYMAAGGIPIGPKMDIVLEEDGQQTVEEDADAILTILRMPESKRLEMAAAARRRASRFSEQRFYEDFKAAVRPILSRAS